MLSPPAPLLPRIPPGRDLTLTDIAPLELARQLTILEFGYFQKIKPIECLNKAWNRDDGEEKAPNVRSVIHTANVLSGWVVINVLSSKDVKLRAGVIKYFVQTALVSSLTFCPSRLLCNKSLFSRRSRLVPGRAMSC